MEQSSKFLDRSASAGEDILGFLNKLLDCLQFTFPMGRHLQLLLRNFGCCTREAGEIEGQMLFKFLDPFMANYQRLNIYGAILPEVGAVQATICRAHLILGSNSFMENVLFYMDCIGGKRPLVPHFVSKCI